MGGSTRTPITQHLAAGLTLMTPNRAASQGQLRKRYYLRQWWWTLSLTSPLLESVMQCVSIVHGVLSYQIAIGSCVYHFTLSLDIIWTIRYWLSLYPLHVQTQVPLVTTVTGEGLLL